jgi:uncharacterized membrane protein YhhN
MEKLEVYPTGAVPYLFSQLAYTNLYVRSAKDVLDHRNQLPHTFTKYD